MARARRYFEQETGADDAGRSKPDPDIVQAALAKLGLPPARCVMMGDAACRAGVAFVGLRCGG